MKNNSDEKNEKNEKEKNVMKLSDLQKILSDKIPKNKNINKNNVIKIEKPIQPQITNKITRNIPKSIKDGVLEYTKLLQKCNNLDNTDNQKARLSLNNTIKYRKILLNNEYSNSINI